MEISLANLNIYIYETIDSTWNLARKTATFGFCQLNMERKTDRGSEKPGLQVDFEVPYFQIHPLLGGFHSHGVPFALDGFYKGKSQSKTDDVSRATPTTKRKPPFSGSRQSVRICKVEFLSFSGCVNRENKPSATPNITGEKS